MPAPGPLRVAIVLGAAVWPGEKPSPTLARRTAKAVDLFRSGQVNAILGCGGLGRHPPSEAEVIRRSCRAAGVPDEGILCEDQSTSTAENLANALAILADHDVAGVIVVTDRYHIPRTRILARRLGLEANFVAAAPSTSPWPRRLRAWLREGAAIIWMLIRRP